MHATVQQVALYAASPFYMWPWKPLLSSWHGSGYDVAYMHFRRDHSDGLNLLLHLVCLVMQLFGNFALLSLLDARLWSLPVLRVTSAAAWVAFLSAEPSAPPLVKFEACAAVVAGCVLAPRVQLRLLGTVAPTRFAHVDTEAPDDLSWGYIQL